MCAEDAALINYFLNSRNFFNCSGAKFIGDSYQTYIIFLANLRFSSQIHVLCNLLVLSYAGIAGRVNFLCC